MVAGAGLCVLFPALVVAQNQVPDCVTVRGEARWGADAYNHVVVVQNRCEALVRCQVATNVNPQATALEVPAGETRELLTFLGSPAREFTPRVQCQLVR